MDADVINVCSSEEEAEEAPAQQAAGWACPACTFVNQPRFLACEVCLEERPNPRSANKGSGAAGIAANGAAADGTGASLGGQQQQQQQDAPAADAPSGSGWVCAACTFKNAGGQAECEMCGASAAGLKPAAAASGQAERSPAEQPGSGGGAAAAAAAGPSQQTAPATNTEGTAAKAGSLPALSGVFVLDCGCRLPAAEVQSHMAQLAGALPAGLAELCSHFRCPQEHCRQLATLRDLDAVLGRQQAGKVAAHFWAAAAAAAAAGAAGSGAAEEAVEVGSEEEEEEEEETLGSGGPGSPGQRQAVDVVDLSSPGKAAAAAQGAGPSRAGAAASGASGAAQEAAKRCTELARQLLRLHGILVDGTLTEEGGQKQQDQKEGKAGKRRRGKRKQQDEQQQQGASAAQAKEAQQAQPEEAKFSGGSSRRRGRATKQGKAAGGAAAAAAGQQAGPPAKKAKPWNQPPPWAHGGGYGGGMWAGGNPLDEYDEEEDYGEYYDEDEDEGVDPEAGGFFGGALGGAWGGFWGGRGRGGQRGGKQANRPKGVGYGGGHGWHGSGQQARKKQEDAAQRQQQRDAAAGRLLSRLRQRLEAWAEEAAERLAPLPLPLLAALRGGPLAPLLRLLTHNDSLMDVSGRRGLYSEVFKLVAAMAGSTDLLPLLLQPADSDLLKAAKPAQQAQQQQQQEAGAGEAAAEKPAGRRPSRGKGSSTPAAKAAAAAAGGGSGKAEEQAEEGQGPSEDTSCWQALQALRLQADIFRRNAEQLAAEGNEEDLQLVGAILDVGECCQRVQEAVDMWRASTQQEQPPAAATGPGGSGQAQQQQQAQQQGEQAGPSGGKAAQQAVDSPELRQRYERELKPLLFQSLPLLGDHYFAREASTQGGLSDRLRRITKEVATLPGQLPCCWESSILAAMDEDNMGVLRAVIFPPSGTPYACGAFAFDILLPPEYPNAPPKVQFLTTGGGRARFNPNLYENGKVCLSLLGTWAGPSWDPGQSTLLQVLISIQSMILGTEDPYFNEPGYASMEGTAQGSKQSEAYNRQIRKHTLQIAVLDSIARPPAGFEEAVRRHFQLKAGAIKEQARQWARQDGSLKQLAAQVATALDGLAEG